MIRALINWSRRRGDAKTPSPAHPPLEDVAVRLTGQGRGEIEKEVVPLTDRHTVLRWLREMRDVPDQQVWVHRPWGLIVAVTSIHSPITVLFHDGENVWTAEPPNSIQESELTPDQAEYVVLEALTVAEVPSWPHWDKLM